MTVDKLRHRAIVAIDMESSTTRTNSIKASLRASMYEMFDAALRTTGITEDERDPLVDLGDGILALVHPADNVPKTELLSTAMRHLATELADQDRRSMHSRLRLRAVVHAGEVHYDDQGCFGESLDIAFRLLNAPEVKEELRRSTNDLSVVVSGEIYRSIGRHGYRGLSASQFKRITRVRVGGRLHQGWTYMPWSPPSRRTGHPALPLSR